MQEPPTLHEIENHQFAYFSKKSGVAIDAKKDSVIAFTRLSGRWIYERLSFSDIRDVETIKKEYSADRLPSRVVGIGNSIGTGIADTVQMAKARRESGISFEFRSLDNPTFFISIPNDKERSRIFEAIRQIIEGSLKSERFTEIPQNIRQELRGIGQRQDGDAARKFIDGQQTRPEDEHGISSKGIIYIMLGAVVVVVLLAVLVSLS